jgi:hypothetical protein
MMRIKVWLWRQLKAYCPECGREFWQTKSTHYVFMDRCSIDCSVKFGVRFLRSAP